MNVSIFSVGDGVSSRLSLGESPFTLKLVGGGGGGGGGGVGSGNGGGVTNSGGGVGGLTRSASMTNSNSIFSDTPRTAGELQKEILKLKKDLEMKNIEMESKEVNALSDLFITTKLKKYLNLLIHCDL